MASTSSISARVFSGCVGNFVKEVLGDPDGIPVLFLLDHEAGKAQHGEVGGICRSFRQGRKVAFRKVLGHDLAHPVPVSGLLRCARRRFGKVGEFLYRRQIGLLCHVCCCQDLSASA